MNFWFLITIQGALTILWMFYPMLFEKWEHQGRMYYPHGEYIDVILDYSGPRLGDREAQQLALTHFKVVMKWKKILGAGIIALYFVSQIMGHYGVLR